MVKRQRLNTTTIMLTHDNKELMKLLVKSIESSDLRNFFRRCNSIEYHPAGNTIYYLSFDMQRTALFTSLLTTLSSAFHTSTPLSLSRRTLRPTVNNVHTNSFSSTTKLNMSVVDKPYGSWSSPITSKSITAGSVKLGNIYYNTHTNNLYWLEGRPQEAGRNVLCKFAPLDDNASERGGVDIMSSKESNVRTRVHEYGGGAVVHGKVWRIMICVMCICVCNSIFFFFCKCYMHYQT